MSRVMRAGGFALVVLLVAGLAAGPAAAKKKKKKAPGIVTRSAAATATGPASVASATATCPKKTRAVSGGFQISPPAAGFGALGLVYESQKVGQNAWRVSLQSIDTGPPDTVTLVAHVYCRKGAPATSTSATTLTKPAALQRGPAPVAVCTGNKNAMFGGLLTGQPVVGSAAKEITLESVRTTSKTWQSDYFSGAVGANSLTTYAYCAKAKAPGAVTTVSAPILPSETVVPVSATCPGKKKVVGGAFTQPTISTTPPGGYFFVLESLRAGPREWRVVGFKVSTNPATIGSTAYCA